MKYTSPSSHNNQSARCTTTLTRKTTLTINHISTHASENPSDYTDGTPARLEQRKTISKTPAELQGMGVNTMGREQQRAIPCKVIKSQRCLFPCDPLSDDHASCEGHTGRSDTAHSSLDSFLEESYASFLEEAGMIPEMVKAWVAHCNMKSQSNLDVGLVWVMMNNCSSDSVDENDLDRFMQVLKKIWGKDFSHPDWRSLLRENWVSLNKKTHSKAYNPIEDMDSTVRTILTFVWEIVQHPDQFRHPKHDVLNKDNTINEMILHSAGWCLYCMQKKSRRGNLSKHKKNCHKLME